ncbi:protein of unknown function [Modestobacter italicus]|uniref:Uncharacterized protein n=1 Tax=Modestobacter italicus (strain DSM 44449 / CECT 9708 / BC 501) TaxID=2732864 RepID=I4ET27_MODI5|nr:protein of unknown function [Modestobacter marinus]
MSRSGPSKSSAKVGEVGTVGILEPPPAAGKPPDRAPFRPGAVRRSLRLPRARRGGQDDRQQPVPPGQPRGTVRSPGTAA